MRLFRMIQCFICNASNLIANLEEKSSKTSNFWRLSVNKIISFVERVALLCGINQTEAQRLFEATWFFSFSPSHKSGSVGDLRRIRSAISVARKVLDHTKVSLLVGDQATQFARQMGFKEQTLTSNRSAKMWKEWKTRHCQPNYWINVRPDPSKHCGPYKPNHSNKFCVSDNTNIVNEHNHDTIGMVAIDTKGRMAVGTSTNGLKFKISGRVGDSPIPGAGAYVDQEIGGAACTGDGDVTMRFLPSYQAVENLRNGMSPMEAAENAIGRIATKYPNNQAALVVASISGEFGAACYGFANFPFSVCNGSLRNTTVKTISCLKPEFGANVSQK